MWTRDDVDGDNFADLFGSASACFNGSFYGCNVTTLERWVQLLSLGLVP